MEAHELIRCRGHPLVRGLHRTTFEVTKEEELTSGGDCIIGVCADKGAADLHPGFRRLLSDDRACLTTRIMAGDLVAEVHSRGSSAFTLDHPSDLVWRRSTYVCGRTVGISSDLVARTIPREIIRYIRNGGEVVIEMTVVVSEDRRPLSWAGSTVPIPCTSL